MEEEEGRSDPSEAEPFREVEQEEQEVQVQVLLMQHQEQIQQDLV